MDFPSIRPVIPDEGRPHQFMRGMVLAAPIAGLIWVALFAFIAFLLSA